MTLPLGYLGPVAEHVTGLTSSGKGPIFAAVALAILVLILLRREARALALAIESSLSGLAIGVTGGFFTVALLSGRPMAMLLALKWSIGAAFLTWLFCRTLNERALSEDEIAVESDRDLRRILGVGRDVDLSHHISTLPDSERNRLGTAILDDLATSLDESSARMRALNRQVILILGLATVCLIAVAAVVRISR